MTLYLFTRDQANVSNCYDQCAQLWPPLLIATGEPMAGPDVPGRLGLHTRRDGSRQVTYNGLPLYYYTPDTQPGDARGQNVGGVWFVVGPNASPSASPSPAR
ncbi:MAG: hypothetical protein HY329_20745 [Chloroflexi bacterium]|nr:hypothetical protein [Chloroflexota bacterium]